MKHSVTSRNGAAQVKQGQVELIVADYEEFEGDVFLLQTEGRYVGKPSKSTTTLLEPDLLIEFCLSNLDMMPDPIRRWARLSVNADPSPETEPISSAELFRA